MKIKDIYQIKRLGIVFLLLCCSPGMLSAALAPYYQSAREITAVLNHPEVVKILGPSSIEAILKKDNVYVVEVGECQLEVEVIYKKKEKNEQWAGPVSFDLKILEKTCDDVTLE